MPSDSFTLAVIISGQVKLIGFLQVALKLSHHFLLIRVNHIVGGEVTLHVHGKLPEGALLHIGRQFGRLRQVTDMTNGGLDVVVRA